MELAELSLELIGIGIVFMLLAVLKTRSILLLLKGKTEINSWRILFFMMMFFLAGYIAALYLILAGHQKLIAFLTGIVFLLGAVFVFIITRVSSVTINDLILKDKSDELNMELKKNETIINQKSEALEQVNKELEDERKQLENKIGERTSELKSVNLKLSSEIIEHKKSEQELAENKNRLERQNRALHKITKCFELDNENLEKSILKVTEISSETVEVERVCVWLYDELKTSIRCIDLYERSKKKHSDGMVLSSENYPTYFKSLELNRVIDASDALKDPRTREYAELYLKPLGIISMLDAPIRKAGDMIGIVCFEHVGPQRNWTIDEQLFCGAIADSISILLESIERIKAEKALQEKEKQLSSIYDTVGDSIFVIAPEKDGRYKFISVNKIFETTTGINSNQVLGKYVDEIIPQPALNIVLDKYQSAVRDKKIIRWEEVSNYPTGQLTGEVSIAPIFDENGNCTFLVGSVHDISDRKKIETQIQKLNEELEERVKIRTSELEKTEESLRNSEEKYRKIVEEAGDVVYSSDFNGNFTYVNPTSKKLTGYEDKELIGKNYLEIIAPEWKEKVKIFYKDQFDKRIQETLFSFPIITKKGEQKWVEQIVTQQQDGDKIIGHQAIVRDITQRIKSEEELKQKSSELERSNKELKYSEGQIQSIFDSAPDAVIVINHESIVLKWNHKAEMLFGWNESEIIGKPIYEYIIPERYRERHKAGMKHYLETGEGPVLNKEIEIEAINKKGNEFSVLLGISPVGIKDEKLFIGFVRDISEKKKSEETLKNSENFLNSIIENIPNMLFVKDAKDLKFLRFNKAGEELLGYSKEELIGKNDYDFFPKIEADFFTNKDKKVLESGQLLQIYEEPIHTKYKGERILETKKIPIFDSQGKPIYLLGISNDITEQKKNLTELDNKTKELDRSNKELEQFAYIASHDLQEPLRMVNSYLQLLEKRYKDKLDKDANDFINFAVDGSNRMRTLISSLLDYSRVNRVKPFEDINLNELLKEVLGDLKASILESKAVITIEPLPAIFADKVLIGQLFQNLLSNALKFKGERNPEILISGKKNNDEYLFFIKDNGIGIQKEYASKLFVIFQRLNTKDQYPGTGIGLAICKKIVERHGGKIWFESEFGKGTTFYFTIKEKVENPIEAIPKDEKPKEEKLKEVDKSVINITA